jgi:tripartite-type tricarboxylate transporter receptor subunit TctC
MDRIYVPIVYRTGEEFRKLAEDEYKGIEKMIRDLGLHKSQKK